MNEMYIGLNFIFIGSLSFITRYIVGAIITSVLSTYSRDSYYSNVTEFGGHLLIFSIVCWILGIGFILYYRVKTMKIKGDNNED